MRNKEFEDMFGSNNEIWYILANLFGFVLMVIGIMLFILWLK